MKSIQFILASASIYLSMSMIEHAVLPYEVRKYGTKATARSLNKLDERVERLETVFDYRY